MIELPGINRNSVDEWILAHIPRASTPLRYTRIAGGQSNLTYLVDTAGGSSYVLRRPPLGTLAPRAHDVAREYRILQALAHTSVPVPRVYGLCTDVAVSGAPFYVMDWVEGTIIDSAATALESLPDADSRRRAAFSLVDTLAEMHAIDPGEIGLGDLGRPTHFIARNIARMKEVWDRTKTADFPLIDTLHRRLLESIPEQRYTGLIHSDFRFGNVILRADYRIAAVLDWELCTIGDVLADLGYLLNNWDQPDDPWPDVWVEKPATRIGEFPTRKEIVERYSRRTGYDVDCLAYYQAFSYWRLAVIAEGIKRRHLTGAIGGDDYDISLLEKRVRDRADMAERMLSSVEAA